MTKVSARWVPRMLSLFQMRVRVEIREQFLARCGHKPDLIINRFVTGDETWVHDYDPDSKRLDAVLRVPALLGSLKSPLLQEK